MFRNAQSPFSALDGCHKKPTKQGTLAGFLGDKSAKKKPFVPLNRGKENLPKKEEVRLQDHREARKSASFGGTSFKDRVDSDTNDNDKPLHNFKHSKPLTKHLSFTASKVKSTHSSIKLSEGNSKRQHNAKRNLVLPIAPSKRRQLPWSGNPRLREHSQETTTTRSGTLSEEQEKVLAAIMFGHKNVFFSGSAGTGKSYLLRTIIRRLRNRYGPSAVAVTASTGLAATNIEGTTLNRFAGIGLGVESAMALVGKIRHSRISTDRWKSTRYLIMDEVSMVDATMFTKLNEIAKTVRGIDKPFGGIQLIITGDFFQLPPVSRSGSAEFCFNCPAWKECIQETYLLTKIFRQSGDLELIDMLNALRMGHITPYIRDKFKALERPLKYEDGIQPTELYPTRDEVERANRTRLASIAGEELTFHAKDSFGPEFAGKPPPFLQNQLNNLMCAQVLRLKEGAQVMNIKNDLEDASIVNGTIGRVMCFTTAELWAHYCSKVNEFEQLPFLSLFIYASKFIGGDADLDHTLYEEMVASNPSALNRVDLLPDLIHRAKQQRRSNLMPLVKFTVNSFEGYKLKFIEPMDFAAEGRADVVRTQLPIILSWALSIHKSQGQTLNRVRVDLTRVFEKGQVYVALSRCVSTDGLEIVNFNESKIQVRKDVVRFYGKLKKLQSK